MAGERAVGPRKIFDDVGGSFAIKGILRIKFVESFFEVEVGER